MVLRNRSLTTGTDGGCILGLSGLHKSKQTREENKCHSVDRRSPVVFLLVCFNAHQTAALLATGVSPQKIREVTSRLMIRNGVEWGLKGGVFEKTASVNSVQN